VKLMSKRCAEPSNGQNDRSDRFGDGWMLIVPPTAVDWRSGLVTGSSVGPAIKRWIAGGSYKERTS